MKFLTLLCLTALLAIGAGQHARAASSWGIYGEEEARIQATAVDILCALTGDCPDDCGGGRRQMGLLREDGTLLLAIKNNDPFAGTANDLAPFCGQLIEADGLLIRNDHFPMFVVQFKRALPDGEWRRANWFTRDWEQEHGGDGSRWYESDPTVTEELEANGILGLPGVEHVVD